MTKMQTRMLIVIVGAAGLAWWWQKRQEAQKQAQAQKDLAAGMTFATGGMLGDIGAMLGGGLPKTVPL